MKMLKNQVYFSVISSLIFHLPLSIPLAESSGEKFMLIFLNDFKPYEFCVRNVVKEGMGLQFKRK